LSLQEETDNKITDINSLLEEIGSDSTVGQELSNLQSLLQNLSNGLGTIASVGSRKRRGSDCSTVKNMESTADAIIPVLNSIEAESSNVKEFISRTKSDITNIKSTLPLLHQQC